MTVKLYRYGGKDIVVNKTLPSTGTDYLSIAADYGFEGNQDGDSTDVQFRIYSGARPLLFRHLVRLALRAALAS